MAELEKAIKGLRCLSNPYIQDMDERDCENCKYDNASCFLDVTADALSLLKAQEPRVMTLEKAKNSEFCFCESGSVFACHMFVDPADGFATIQQFGRPDLLIDSNEYGISFRCWTSRPTDEQRETTPWAEPPKEET